MTKTPIDFSHLDAIQNRIANYRARLANAKNENDRAFFEREIVSGEKEEAAEYAFLGIKPATIDEIMSDDDLLGELGS